MQIVLSIALTLVIGAACIHDLAMRPAGSATLALLLVAGWFTASAAWIAIRRADAAALARREGTDYLLRRAHVRSGFIALGWGTAFALIGWGEFTLLGRSYGDVAAGFVAGAEAALCILVPAALFTVGATHGAVRRLKAGAPPVSPGAPWEQSWSESWILRHWRGHYHLPRAFWLHGVGLNVAYDVLSAALGLIAARVDVRLSAIVGMALLLAYPPILVWQGVGIWRSARQYRLYYRRRAGAWAAQVFIAAAALVAVRFYIFSAPVQFHELDEILRGDPQWDQFSTRLMPDGKSLLIVGNLQAGCHERFRQALESAPDVRTILIDSPGGRLAEGERMAVWVRQRHLDTRAVGQCASAATVVFLAGRQRSVAPDAHLGFHSPTAPEATWLLQLAMRYQLDLDMRAAGVGQMFVRRTLHTPPESVWYPTAAELFAGGVTTTR